MTDPKIYTTEQVEKRFGIKAATVRLWFRKKIIRGYRLPHTRIIFIDAESLRAALNENSNVPG